MLRDAFKIDGIEKIWVDTQDLLIGVIYNPLDEFEQALHSIFLSKRKCLILGDINIYTLVKSTIATIRCNYQTDSDRHKHSIVFIVHH